MKRIPVDTTKRKRAAIQAKRKRAPAPAKRRRAAAPAMRRRGRHTMTVDQVANLLNRSRMSVYGDLKRGLIPSRKLGNRYVISRVAIMRWLEGSDRK